MLDMVQSVEGRRSQGKDFSGSGEGQRKEDTVKRSTGWRSLLTAPYSCTAATKQERQERASHIWEMGNTAEEKRSCYKCT